ncbi:hypothetical protein JL193_07515 [Polaribacter batillariae]|uniref:Uncharacterized protein n=1 Tax=Polaribacter batillariae TaxID=2808900 RepID=A0ABX7SY06_9FLAO|nr:hypothetical protein [Polaribacter batillariae]QTD39086.1 hypothetical protein JL193_07515 [Polaribacter batillariae]
MNTLQQLTILALLFLQTSAFSQTKNAETVAIKKETVQKKKTETTKVESPNFKKFIGKYKMVEANFILDIVEEKGKMYIITEFSKDPLLPKNKNTLSEPKRGVDFQWIEGNKNGLKYSQNGYETILERVKPKS